MGIGWMGESMESVTFVQSSMKCMLCVIVAGLDWLLCSVMLDMESILTRPAVVSSLRKANVDGRRRVS